MPPLCLFFLGPPYVTLNTRPVNEFRSDNARALLAYLAIEGDRPHRRDALAGLFWPESPDQLARNNLRLTLHRLRQALDDRNKIPLYLQLTSETVQWRRNANVLLDITLFTDLLAKTVAHSHRRLDSCSPCVAFLQRAADLYRGEFLQGFYLENNLAFSEWVLIWRERLHRRVLRTLFHLAEYHRRRGEHEPALGYATRQVELEPWREEAHCQIMRILAAQGERSAALKQYETCRSLLHEGLGIEPAVTTTELYHHLLHTTAHHNLPPSSTPWIGRQEELAELTSLIADPDCRLITVAGPGGIGKTRLALQVANQQVAAFPDGVYFVPLDALPSADYLISAVLRALSATFLPAGDLNTYLLSYLRPRELLLVLDNFEHLLEGTSLIADWLQNAPLVKVLVTSRERLRLVEEWVFDLTGLDYPSEQENEIEQYSSGQLFIQVAQRHHRLYSLLANEKSFVAHLCRLVEGSPLAIELAAAQIKLLSSQEIVQAIEQNLETLTTSLRNVPKRHRNLWAVFEHSWRLLSVVEQEVFVRLSVFRGGFETEAAQQVADATPAMLSRLVDKSLVQVTAQVEAANNQRYTLHELTRQYAQERLNRAGQLTMTREEHLGFFLQVGEENLLPDFESRRLPWLERLDREQENIRAALTWSLETADVQLGLRLADCLWYYWSYRGAYGECRRWLEQLVERAEHTKQGAIDQTLTEPFNLYYGRALHTLGNTCWYQNDYETAVTYLERSLAILQEIDDDSLKVASTLRPLARIVFLMGDQSRAQTLSTRALALFRAHENIRGINRTLIDLGQLMVAKNNFMLAMTYIQEALNQTRAHGLKAQEADTLIALGEAYWYQGQARQAEQCFQEGLALCRSTEHQLVTSMVLQNLAFLFVYREEWEKADAYLQEAITICDEIGDIGGCGDCLVGLAAVAFGNGHVEQAARLCGKVATILHLCHPQLYKPGQMFWPLYPQIERAVRTQLSETAFQAACEEGQQMSLKQSKIARPTTMTDER